MADIGTRSADGRRRAGSRRFLIAGAALLLAGHAAQSSAEERYPVGQIVEKISCRSDPRFSFALYLPKAFDPARTWPLLFLFDARGRGALAAERFRAGAERFGWILVSSNDTRSDDASAPNTDVLQALWSEAPARFPVDRGRIYASGFSGGARLAFLIGLARKGSLAGVIAASGGLPGPTAPDQDPGFAVFGTAGERDFNYREMRALDRTLAKLHARHRLAIFSGGHEWPPAEMATNAIGWMELQAMAGGLRTPDPALAAEIFRESSARAADLERSGDLAAAFEDYDGSVRDFARVGPEADVEQARRNAARLRETGRKLRDEAERRESGEAAAVRRLLSELETILAANNPMPSAAAANRLEISRWRERAATGPPLERQSAQRVLEALFTQSGFYAPEALFARHEPRKAALALEIATMVAPDRPFPWYDLACARALAGESAKAIEALRTAVEKGFHDAAHARTDPDLASVRDREDFAKILAAIRDGPGIGNRESGR